MANHIQEHLPLRRELWSPDGHSMGVGFGTGRSKTSLIKALSRLFLCTGETMELTYAIPWDQLQVGTMLQEHGAGLGTARPVYYIICHVILNIILYYTISH